MSRSELADSVNAHLWRATGRRYMLDAHAIARYERGVVRWPNAAYRSGLRAVLGARSDAELGFRPAPRPAQPMGAADGSLTDPDPMKRRQFLASAAALAGSCSAVGAQQLAPMLERLTVARVGDADVEALRRAAGLLSAQTQAVGGGTLRRLAVDAYRGVRRLLDEADYSNDVGTELVTTAGEFAACAGWTAYDVGDQRAARALFTDAALLAGQNGDTPLLLRALNALTLQSAHLADGGRRRGPAREAWRCAERMADLARSERSPRLHALIAGHQVVASALVRDTTAFTTAVGRAWRETDRLSRSADSPPWLGFIGPDAVATYVARGHRYLGEAGRAVAIFGEYVGEADASPWNRENYRAQLAVTLADAGDTARAAELGSAVLGDLDRAAISSPRTVALLEPVCGTGS